jgi:hypothetical protein
MGWLSSCLSFQKEPCCAVLPCSHSPLTIYTWKLKHSQTIWGKKLLLGILKEQFENFIRTDKQQMNPPSWTPITQKGKKLSTLSFVIGCMKFLFSKSLPPFSTWANTPIIVWGYLFCFISISWGCLTCRTNFFLQWANLIGPSH